MKLFSRCKVTEKQADNDYTLSACYIEFFAFWTFSTGGFYKLALSDLGIIFEVKLQVEEGA